MSKTILLLSILTLIVSCSGNSKKSDLVNSNRKNEKKSQRYRNIARERNISDTINTSDFKSDSKIQTLILNYNAIACTCAQWSKADTEENLSRKDYYWLEPAEKSLIDADHLFDGTHLLVKIKVTGQVITEKGFPKYKNLSKVNENEAGKVFRYTKIEVLQK